MQNIPVIGVNVSENRKIGLAAATYVSQASCPKSCPFYNAGCYAEQGLTGIHTKRVNKAQKEGKQTPRELAELEAITIRNLNGKLPLRLHVVGDCKNAETAEILAAAAKDYTDKHGQIVWSYTHAKRVPRSAWGNVSILRSCDNITEAKAEHKRGFSAAVVVTEKFTSHKIVDLGDGFKGVPCPYQTGKAKDCIACGLCLNADKLHKGKLVILFQPDANTEKRIGAALSTK